MASIVENVADGIEIIHSILLREVRGVELFRSALILEKVAKIYAENVDELHERTLMCHAQMADLSIVKEPMRPTAPSSTSASQPLTPATWNLNVPEPPKLEIFSCNLLRKEPPSVKLMPKCAFEEVNFKYLFCPSKYGFPPLFLVSEGTLIDKDQFAVNALRFSDQESNESEDDLQEFPSPNTTEKNQESSSEEEFFDLYPTNFCETQDDEEELLLPEFGYHFLAPLLEPEPEPEPEPEEVVKDIKKKERKKRVRKEKKLKPKEKIKRMKFMNLDDVQVEPERQLEYVPENFDCFVNYQDADFGAEEVSFQSEESFEVPKKTRRKRRAAPAKESGICMNLYREKVLHLLTRSPEGTIDFFKDIKFECYRDIPLHFLAILHLATENKIEVVPTKPLTVNQLKIVILRDSS